MICLIIAKLSQIETIFPIQFHSKLFVESHQVRAIESWIRRDWFELFSRDADNATSSLMNRRNKTRVGCFQTFYVVFPKDPFYKLFCYFLMTKLSFVKIRL